MRGRGGRKNPLGDVQADHLAQGKAALALDPGGDAAAPGGGGLEALAMAGVAVLDRAGGQGAGPVVHVHDQRRPARLALQPR